MNNSIYAAPVYTLEELNNLFIEMTSQNCNQRCNSCFIKFPINKKIKDFITIDRVKEGLLDSKNDNLYCIYLTGAEPMTHPDFNTILRLCLKRCNVCICTNGSFLNEKKIRFLKKVEEEGNNQIFFKLSLCHHIEAENDKSKYRGNYRQTIYALKNLSRYNFNTVLNIQNFYNLSEEELINNFNKILSENNIINTDIQISVSYSPIDTNKPYTRSSKTDCMHGRVLCQNGVYTCPFLSNDYRGRVGSSLKDYSKNVTAETDFCTTCSRNNDYIFAIG